MEYDLAGSLYFPVFGWEKEVVNLMQTSLYSGSVYSLMEFLSDFGSTWWLILLIVYGLIKKYGVRWGLGYTLILSVAVLLADLISYRLIKALVMRPRPGFPDAICISNDCLGFISSHATNTFCVAVLISALLGKKWAPLAFTFALIVSFSRIYLGKHYPLDVIGGAILGILFGIGLLKLGGVIGVGVYLERTTKLG